MARLNTTLITIGIICAVGIILNLLLQLRRSTPSSSIAEKESAKEIGELEEALKEERSQKNKLIGQNRELFAQHERLKAEHGALLKERDALKMTVTKFETKREQQDKEHQDLVGKLDVAQLALREERQRVVREDEERRQKALEERDRIWAEHENRVISLLTDLCKKPEFGFACYDNTNLPEDFHGSLKPDFLVEFLEQYVIFDAKVSKATNMQVYVNDQVKATAKKVKGKEKIYPTIFLVVPTDVIGELKQTHFYEEALNFYVVSPESLAPILASLKKIKDYEFADVWDPQEREALADLLAQFDFHVSTRNAVDFHLMQHGIETLSKTQRTDPELAREVAIKKAKMRALNFKSADQKLLTASPDLLEKRLLELIEPKSQIAKEDIQRLKR